MRHFKKLNEAFLKDLASYISTYAELNSKEHEQACENAIEAIDDYYEESAVFAGLYKAEAEQMPSAAPQIHGQGDIILPEKQPTFQQNLFKIIDGKGYKDSQVYKKADIDRRLFSKIRSDVDYHPSKSTSLKICLALELDIIETEKLLESAGYCMSLSDTADLVVRYCIEHKTYKLMQVNEALDYFGQKPL